MARIEGNMNDREVGYKKKIEEMQHDLEGAQAQADMRVSKLTTVCKKLVEKYKVPFFFLQINPLI
jgi:hypothetical protein